MARCLRLAESLRVARISRKKKNYTHTRGRGDPRRRCRRSSTGSRVTRPAIASARPCLPWRRCVAAIRRHPHRPVPRCSRTSWHAAASCRNACQRGGALDSSVAQSWRLTPPLNRSDQIGRKLRITVRCTTCVSAHQMSSGVTAANYRVPRTVCRRGRPLGATERAGQILATMATVLARSQRKSARDSFGSLDWRKVCMQRAPQSPT